MEIKREQLSIFLKKDIHFPVYIVSGNEIVLVQEALDNIRVALKNKGFLERELYIIEREFDWARLIRTSFQRSLLTESSYKIVECRWHEGSITTTAQQAIKQYIEKPSKICVWVIHCPQIPKSEYKKPWFITVKEKGVLIHIWKLDTEHHSHFIKQKLHEANLSMTSSALHLLSEYTEGNLLAVKQTIEHFRSMAFVCPIPEEAIQSTLLNFSTPEVFDIIELWLKEDTSALFRSLSQLKLYDETAHLRLVGAFIFEIRNLTRMAEEIAKGISISNVLQIFKVWPRKKKWITIKLQKTPLQKWYDLWNALTEIEYIQKGIQTGDVWQSLTALL